MNENKYGLKIEKTSVFVFVHLLLITSVFFAGCNQLEKPKTEPFYSQTEPPPKQEFRWSNGKTPKSFDPALAAAPPETDVVRAVFDGLTDTDPKTLQPIPAVAKDWKSSDDEKTWTFYLRRDAKWSNGETVKAQDFVRSWKRLAEMGEKVSRRELLENIVGVEIFKKKTSAEKEAEKAEKTEKLEVLSRNLKPENLRVFPEQSNSNSVSATPESATDLPKVEKNANAPVKAEQKSKIAEKPETKFGVEAVDNFTLVVSLVKADKDFPALVAHPIFRPIYGDGRGFETGKLNAGIVTNGAFRIFSVGQDGITLDRADYYWNRKDVELERVRFVPTENAEKALEAYRAGEIDALTNADFEPLALKLLTPFNDFRRTAHSALNFYEFNRSKKPFADRRVRESLAIAIERERLTEDEMDGASVPALGFLPFDEKRSATKFSQDANRAKTLLAEAGFPGGANFPPIKLLVNRNNVQQRIAKSVAKMWKQNLNVETEIIVREAAEVESIGQIDDFDVIRRGAVFATTDEAVNLRLLFNQSKETGNVGAETEIVEGKEIETSETPENSNNASVAGQPDQPETSADAKSSGENVAADVSEKSVGNELISNEAEVFNRVPAIPLYFSTSYSLVKPYVQGFEINMLDAPSLKNVKINNAWQAKTSNGN